MSDSLAHRVASRFLVRQARGRDDLLQQLENAAQRSDTMLKMVEQQHRFWSRSIAEGKPLHDVEAQHHRINALIKSYEQEVEKTMRMLAAVGEAEQEEEAEGLQF